MLNLPRRAFLQSMTSFYPNCIVHLRGMENKVIALENWKLEDADKINVISNFSLVLNVVFFPLGDSPASEHFVSSVFGT